MDRNLEEDRTLVELRRDEVRLSKGVGEDREYLKEEGGKGRGVYLGR